MNIVLLGIQGSGKGTLVMDLSNYMEFDLVSVGQLLREEVATGSDLGKQIKQKQDAGMLVDLDIVIATVKKVLKNHKKQNVVFDGFPRDTAQADALDKICKLDKAVYLRLDKETALSRLVNRLTCNKCGFITTKQKAKTNVCPECGGKLVTRADDTAETITKRFDNYEKETMPLIDRYKKAGILVEVDANRTPKEVLQSVLKELN